MQWTYICNFSRPHMQSRWCELTDQETNWNKPPLNSDSIYRFIWLYTGMNRSQIHYGKYRFILRHHMLFCIYWDTPASPTFLATMAVKIVQNLPLVVQRASRSAANCLHDDNRWTDSVLDSNYMSLQKVQIRIVSHFLDKTWVIHCHRQIKHSVCCRFPYESRRNSIIVYSFQYLCTFLDWIQQEEHKSAVNQENEAKTDHGLSSSKPRFQIYDPNRSRKRGE